MDKLQTTLTASESTHARLAHEPAHYFAHTHNQKPASRSFFKEALLVASLVILAALVLTWLK